MMTIEEKDPYWYDILNYYYTFDEIHTETIDDLLKNANGNKIIDKNHKTIPAEGYTKIIKLIFNHPHFNSINAVNCDKETAFMLACRKGHLNVVKLFMSNPNFDSLNYKNIDGQTAYVLAYQYGHNNNKIILHIII
jgi:ankyrin repeat protein